MAIALDSSSPAEWNLTYSTATDDSTGTSASFTPPVDSIITLSIASDTISGVTPTATITNTGFTVDAWSLRGSRGDSEGTAGIVYIYRARVTASAAGTISVTINNSHAGGGVNGGQPARAKACVWTGADTDQTGAATGENSFTTNTFTGTVLTTTRNNSQVVVAYEDWNATTPAPTTSQSGTGFRLTHAGGAFISGIFTHQTNVVASSGTAVAGSVDWGGTGASDTNWVALEILEAAGGGTQFTQAVSGTLSFIGNKIQRTSRGLSGVLNFTGNAAKRISHSVAGSLSFTGAVLRKTIRQLGGQLSFSGNATFTRLINAALSATLNFVGTLSSSKSLLRALTATLSFAGNISKHSSRGLSGVISTAGTISKRTSAIKTATLTFAGLVAKKTSRALQSTASFAGSLLSGIAYIRALTATLSFTGAITAQSVITRLLTASLSFTGAVQKRTSKAMGGTLNLTGLVVKRLAKVTESTLSFIGQVTKAGIPARLASTLTFTGVLMRRMPVHLASVLSFLGSLVGNLRVGIEVLLESTLSFSGSLLSKFQKLLGVGLFRVIGRGTLWRK